MGRQAFVREGPWWNFRTQTAKSNDGEDEGEGMVGAVRFALTTPGAKAGALPVRRARRFQQIALGSFLKTVCYRGGKGSSIIYRRFGSR